MVEAATALGATCQLLVSGVKQGTEKVKPPTLSFPVLSPPWPVESLTDDTDVRGVASSE